MRGMLALGVRLAFSGGYRGWIRTVLAAAGVAIGAAVLLLAASVPVMLDAEAARVAARGDNGAVEVPAAGRTVLVAGVESEWAGDEVRGRLIWPEAPDAPLPPGVRAFPGDRQMYVSPALREALAGPDGDVLRLRMPYEIVGTIEPAGLSGPRELAYYAGYRRAADLVGTGSWRIDSFGRPARDDQGTSAGTVVVVAAMMATLLLPIAIFIGAALRFGADVRDRRLAAIRLVGADSRAVLRIALGESLVPAMLGLLAGTVVFLLARGLATDVELFGVSVFPADIRPVPALAVLVVLLVLALAGGLTLLGFRGVAVEPLGVFRRSAVWNGRLWWRLLPVAASLALLYPVALGDTDVDEDRTGLGVILTIAALIPLLPYLVPLVARLLPGGPVSWQLAAQQLRRNPTASTRALTGIVVAVTGAIALHSFYAAASIHYLSMHDPAEPSYVFHAGGTHTPAAMRQRSARFEQIRGVRAGTVSRYELFDPAGVGGSDLIVGDCDALARIATLNGCTDGDVFTFGEVGRSVNLRAGDEVPTPGRRIPLPAHTRPATLAGSDAQNVTQSVLVTSGAAPRALAGVEPRLIETRMFTTDGASPTVGGRLRGVAAEIDPLASFTAIAPDHDKFAPLRSALNLGSTVILLMMGVGLLLDVASRLHDRRRLLGVLGAVGARRSTVVWSVLLQVIAPLLAGLALAAGVGAALGAVLMRMSQVPVAFGGAAVLAPVAVGAGLVLATTVAVLLPAVRRIAGTEELRYE